MRCAAGCGGKAGRNRYGVDNLMCRRHWHRVDKATQARVWSTYKAWRRDQGDLALMREYELAVAEAVRQAQAGEPGHEQLSLTR